MCCCPPACQVRPDHGAGRGARVKIDEQIGCRTCGTECKAAMAPVWLAGGPLSDELKNAVVGVDK